MSLKDSLQVINKEDEMAKKNYESEFDKCVRLCRENGLTYAEFQKKESLGLAKIVGGKLLIKGRDY